MAKKLEDKPENIFVANTEPNPKERCKAVTTRSGKVLDGVVVRKEDKKKDVNVEKEEEVEEKDEGESHNGKQIMKPLPYPQDLI